MFCCWRVPSLQRTMIKYFTSNPASSGYSQSTPLHTPQSHLAVVIEINGGTALNFMLSSTSPSLTLSHGIVVVCPLQRLCAPPCCSPHSVTSPFSTWLRTCTFSGASPPAPYPCWAESNLLLCTCLQVQRYAPLQSWVMWPDVLSQSLFPFDLDVYHGIELIYTYHCLSF